MNGSQMRAAMSLRGGGIGLLVQLTISRSRSSTYRKKIIFTTEGTENTEEQLVFLLLCVLCALCGINKSILSLKPLDNRIAPPMSKGL